jgi:hypothetical protein
MTNTRRATMLGALLIIATLLVAACGGATATTAPDGEATPPAGEATPPPAGEATPPPAGEATPDLAIPTFDLDALTGGLPGVDSYRTQFSVDGEGQYTSVVVTKPVLSKAITIEDNGEVSQRFTIIGDEAWVASGSDGEFEPVPAQMASSMLTLFDPAMLLGAFGGANIAGVGALVSTEEKHGVQARHVKIDQGTAAGFAASMPAGSSIDIWVAEAGYLVAWEMSGFPDEGNISIQVTNVNDPSNKVERPG